VTGAILTIVLVSCGTGTSTGTPTAVATYQADSLPFVRTVYEAAVSQINAGASAFGIEIRQAVKANDAATVYGATQSFWGELMSFDSATSAIRFPSTLMSKAKAMHAADMALETDLQSVGGSPQVWAAHWRSDVVQAQTAHDALTQALGLPDDSFLTMI
jgi:hypothetical protein